MGVLYTTILVSLFCTSFSAPQQSEIIDQYQISDPVTVQAEQSVNAVQVAQTVQQEEVTDKPVEETVTVITEYKANKTPIHVAVPQISFSVKLYKFISEPIAKVVTTPKVNAVLRNIGTCVVNGALELFSYYLPAPLMPLIASAAGLVIPFEPVVMLKEKMPVTSYRRAFQTAMSSFLRTFDKYKIEEDFDPYMTRRFNRRLMNDGKKEVKEENVDAQ